MNKRPAGNILFKVALVADTHVNEAEDFSTSPYPVNAEANPRTRFIFDQINQSGAAFCIHLGDMVHPVPELASHTDAVENFHRLASNLKMPLYLTPGNHDIGDKPVTWMPAGMVNGEHIALYRKRFGRDYFSFDHQQCHFIIINSPLVNSGDPAEAEQAAWLEADLDTCKGKRTFMFSHYPVYVSDPEEPESYDNIDEPGRSWLLDLIRRYKPEALFAGHVHNFWYDVIGETEYYVLPSASFVRHDYSEMYRIDGGSQQGRDDNAKLGHLTLEIYSTGHVAHYHRSYGGRLEEGTAIAPAVIRRPHVKTTGLDGIYVDMRHAWSEEMVVAPSGAVDEFRRKKARNDYPVLALWEIGISGLRVPIQDLEDATTRRRMTLMRDVGHKFHVYCYGLPNEGQWKLLTEHAGLVAQLELILIWSHINDQFGALKMLRSEAGIPIILSRVNRNDVAKISGGRFNHLISHGFTLIEIPELVDFLAGNPELLDGIQFTIPRSQSPWSAARKLAEFAESTSVCPWLYIKSTEASPAERFDDDIANARRFGEALLSGVGHGIGVILDTLDDADRGYFTRTGLIDRRFNPRFAGQLVSELIRQMDGSDWRAADTDTPCLKDETGRTLTFGTIAQRTPGKKWIDPSTGCSETSNTGSGIGVMLG